MALKLSKTAAAKHAPAAAPAKKSPTSLLKKKAPAPEPEADEELEQTEVDADATEEADESEDTTVAGVLSSQKHSKACTLHTLAHAQLDVLRAYGELGDTKNLDKTETELANTLGRLAEALRG